MGKKKFKIKRFTQEDIIELSKALEALSKSDDKEHRHQKPLDSPVADQYRCIDCGEWFTGSKPDDKKCQFCGEKHTDWEKECRYWGMPPVTVSGVWGDEDAYKKDEERVKAFVRSSGKCFCGNKDCPNSQPPAPIKEECNCLCHFKIKPTPEEYAGSSYYGCTHCQKPISPSSVNPSSDKSDYETIKEKLSGYIPAMSAEIEYYIKSVVAQQLQELNAKWNFEYLPEKLQEEKDKYKKKLKKLLKPGESYQNIVVYGILKLIEEMERDE